ncbi:hypothetical protein BN1051_01186 [Arthrobacter saudimassiliensis]|uniref:Tricorn protease homolog n=1 Tax=Arthrobacter saudimassiliensis TaxID=1461584 RepID=A0A078MSR5_9MICC|nr:hypothetical protein BN1051_01186 [Arthrobacter saudimassiliensis]
MSPLPYLRYPHLHDGLVTFVAENDVWLAPVDGGRAWRLSALQLPAANPRFSPDGSTIAWTVVQGSAPEVVSADVEGGQFRQLTFWGTQNTRVRGFTPDGHVLATSPAGHEDRRLPRAYEVPLDGAAPRLLPFGPADTVVHGPAVGDERPVLVGTVITREQAWWKRYRGGTAGRFWIDRDGSGEFVRLVPELDGNLSDPMWIDGRIAFLSDHEGYGNLYSVTPQGGDLRRHTDFDGFYARHAATDGHRIVFESAGRIWLLDSLDDEARVLDIRLGSAATGRRPRPLDVAAHLAGVVPAADGTASVVESHGTLHWLTHRDGPSRTIEATPGVRARLGRPLGADRTVFVSDHDGVETLSIAPLFDAAPARPATAADTAVQAPSAPVEEPGEDEALPLPKPVAASSGLSRSLPAAEAAAGPGSAADAGQAGSDDAPAGQAAEADGATGSEAQQPQGTRRFPLPAPTRIAALAVAPDASRVAAGTEQGQVLLLDVADGAITELAATSGGAVTDLAFSPDARWLAWAEPVAGTERTRIRLQPVDGSGDAVDVTDGRFADHSPSFTRDGKFLAFLSERSFDPVYDTHRFDLSFPSSTKPYLVALAADTPSPFGPSVHPAPPAVQEPGAASDDPADAGDGKPEPVRVDPGNIADRIIPVPVAQGHYDSLTAVDGGLLWLARESSGTTGEGRARPQDQDPAARLERFDLARRETTVLVPAADSYEVSADGKTVVLVHERRVRAVPAAAPVDGDSPENVNVDLGRIRVLLDPAAVWAQEFDEAWRLQRDFFWADDMAGIDWDGVRDRYRPLLKRIGSHDDLVDVLWEMHGELGTSHAYVTPRPAGERGYTGQGFLGADLRRTGRGWEVRRVLASEGSDPQAVSPLSAPGADVHPGDVIEAVDGVAVPAAQGPAALLVNAAGRTVELTVRRPEDGSVRRIAVVPIGSEERLRYQNWVHGNRRVVREASDGSFGYLHIPDMTANGWAQLHRDLDAETAKDALVIDVRRNRGGHTSQLVAELIGRKVNAWTFPRGQEPTSYPSHAPRGPVVVLVDEFAGSDGDIITQIVKLRGIGPVIGTRTWGGVVGIDNRFALADGTVVNQPRYAYWFSGGAGFGVENRGVEPDIEVAFPPHAWAAGEDPQLEQGVAILKEMLSELPTDRPPARSGYPSLRPPALGPRPQDGGA